jgi:hypothetical protein
MARYKDGHLQNFDIEIGMPYRVSDVEFCCEIDSGNVLFRGIKKSYGIDALDCLDYAIQMVDLFSTQLVDVALLWSDGSPYVRLPTDRKFSWAVG